MNPQKMTVIKRYANSLFVWLFLCSLPMVWAGGDAEQPPGVPPFGLKVEGETKGTKLDGVIFIEFYDCIPGDAGTICNATIALRLRQGNSGDLQIFIADVEGVNSSSPLAVQTAITQELETQIIDSFFPGESLTTHLKNITQFAKITVGSSIFVMADVQIAVN